MVCNGHYESVDFEDIHRTQGESRYRRLRIASDNEGRLGIRMTYQLYVWQTLIRGVWGPGAKLLLV